MVGVAGLANGGGGMNGAGGWSLGVEVGSGLTLSGAMTVWSRYQNSLVLTFLTCYLDMLHIIYIYACITYYTHTHTHMCVCVCVCVCIYIYIYIFMPYTYITYYGSHFSYLLLW